MASEYSRVPANEAQTRHAPRPYAWPSTVPPPPKKNKDLFDRCGNCTRAFGFLSRKRHCGNCGFVYCSDCCTEKVRLVKFQGHEARDVKVCDYCKEFLKIDRMPPQVLITMSVRSLREYIEAYGIAKGAPFVEKTDLINTILSAEITEHNEEIFRQTTPGFRDWYKKHERQANAQTPLPNPSPASPSTIRSSSTSHTSNGPGVSQPRPDDPRANAGRDASRSNSASNERPQPLFGDFSVESIRQAVTDAADFFSNGGTLSPNTTPRMASGPRRDPAARRVSATIERQRRPYTVSPEQLSPSTRPRSVSDLSASMAGIDLTQAPFERQRRGYSSINPNTNSPSSSPPPSSVPPSTDLRTLVKQGTEFSTLSTSVLLSIMRANNCPLPPGAVEKEELVNRVEEMASFIIAAPEETPRVRDEDEDDCKICFERVADYCLVPCGHTGFCFMCARKMTSCPFCKKEVGHAQKLWKV